MKLNPFERYLMENPLRIWLQKIFEAGRLYRVGGAQPVNLALEIGCGTGAGVSVIQKRFGVRRVHAFDLDERFARRAARRLRREGIDSPVWVGNARHIPVADGTYDAAFTFGSLHHVVRWQEALREIYRVLKPGGVFLAEEIQKRYITHPIIGRLMDHPQENRFNVQELNEGLRRTGFRVLASDQWLDLFCWVSARKEVSGTKAAA